MAACYRHPSRETGVSCSNCGNPICPDCMTPTSVGMRCPECAKQKTQVKRLADVRRGDEPRVTYVLMAICVIAFLGGSEVEARGILSGPSIALGHDYYRLVTTGFLHADILHIAFNMYLLYLLGQMLEPELGSLRFGVIYFTALLVGSFGALVQSLGASLGASGAVFGLFGAAFVELRRRGIDPFQTFVGPLILINLLFGFLPGTNISNGAHIGGLLGGAAAMFAIQQADRRRMPWLGFLACALIAAAAVAGSIIRADDVLTQLGLPG